MTLNIMTFFAGGILLASQKPEGNPAEEVVPAIELAVGTAVGCGVAVTETGAGAGAAVVVTIGVAPATIPTVL